MRLSHRSLMALPQMAKAARKGGKPDNFTDYAKFSVLKDPSVWPLVTIVSGVACLGVAAMCWNAYSKTDVVFDKTKQPWMDVPQDRPTQKLITINQKYKNIPQLEVLKDLKEE